MRAKIALATLSYLSSIAILLSFLYWFLKNEGFSEFNFLIASVIVLLLATGWGYIISSHLLTPKAELDANLSQLSSEILHELNIPLSVIEANTTLLKKNLKDEKSLKRLRRIKGSSVRLKRLYGELVYSIKKELYPIEKETIFLKSLLQEHIEIFEAYKRNNFLLDVGDVQIRVDKIGFEKMIDNLLMNAMKYSSRDSPINITLQASRLMIIDKGIGMDETELIRVHERYYQSDSKKEGEGIGLALVKAYCDEEEIGIQIKSQKNRGTTVSLNLERVQV